MNESFRSGGRGFLIFAALAVLAALSCSPRETGPMYVLQVSQPADSVILRTPSRDLSRRELRSRRTRVLVSRMLETVQSPEQDGVGIAAPQVGRNLRIICVQRLDKTDEPFESYLNVRIDSLFGEVKSGPEGCLSIPPYRGEVRRHQGVIISYVEPGTLQARRDTVLGFTAVIFQHECDHLDGILYTDRADTVYVDPVWQAEIDSGSSPE